MEVVIHKESPLDIVLRVYKTPGRLARFLDLSDRSVVWKWRKNDGAIPRRHCIKLMATGHFTAHQLLIGEQ